MIILKSDREIDHLRKAGELTARTHQVVADAIEPGVTTGELDRIAEAFIQQQGAKPAFKGYDGFPATICASVNDEIVHGIPGDRELVDGDILSVDTGVIWKGYYGDAAVTHAVGDISDELQHLLDVTRRSLQAGIDQAKAGNRLSDISHAVQSVAEPEGLAVVRDYCGHGVGRDMHEQPQIANYGPPGQGPVLKKGMTLAIEPMLNLGTYETQTKPDGWTVTTKDGRHSAHFEHSIAITDGGPEVLTRLDDGMEGIYW